MNQWTDPISGVVYRWDDSWREAVRQHVAQAIRKQVSEASSVADCANRLAEFWKEYYRWVFPLRYGKQEEAKGVSRVSLFEEKEETIVLEPDRGLRSKFLDGQKLPPILPSETDPSLLIADHHLAVSALLNVALRAKGMDEDTLHQVRVGALVHEVIDLISMPQFPLAEQFARYLKGQEECPSELKDYEQLIRGIHESNSDPIDDTSITIAGVSAQRIKQYVYESPGLPEIRGASQLLDSTVEALYQRVKEEIGAEVVLQSIAATLIFLAPEPADWVDRMKRAFYEATSVAFVSASAVSVPLRDFISAYGEAMRAFLKSQEAERYQAEIAYYEALPFEERCALCKARPAEASVPTPDGESILICLPCNKKRERGKQERRKQLYEIRQHIPSLGEAKIPPP